MYNAIIVIAMLLTVLSKKQSAPGTLLFVFGTQL
jgi:hypothetical protein